MFMILYHMVTVFPLIANIRHSLDAEQQNSELMCLSKV